MRSLNVLNGTPHRMQKSEKFVIVQLKIDFCTLNVKNALLFVQSH